MAGKKEQPAAAPAAAAEKTVYEALTGIDYPDGPENVKLALAGKGDKAKYLRLEKGEKADDLPDIDIPWLLREHFIKVVKD